MTEQDCWYEAFRSQFRFRPDRALMVSVERERFVALEDAGGYRVVPAAENVLTSLAGDRRFSPELSACQIEDRTGPHETHDELRAGLRENDEILRAAAARCGCTFVMPEVGPEDMSLAISSGARFEEIAARMTTEQLGIACRLIGAHVHVGMPSADVALDAYNGLVRNFDILNELSCTDRRAQLYRRMVPEFAPPRYDSWETFHRTACRRRFDMDPRRCYDVIRISPHGTIEVRLPNADERVETVVNIVRIIRRMIHDELGLRIAV